MMAPCCCFAFLVVDAYIVTIKDTFQRDFGAVFQIDLLFHGE